MKINIINQFQSEFPNGNIENLSENKIRVSYETKNKLAKPKPIILPSYINLDENFVEGLGLYIGDGKLTPNDLKHLEFSTVDEDMAKFFIEFLRKRLCITNDHITFSIRYRYGSEGELKKKWVSLLQVSEDKLKTRKYDKYKMLDSITIQVNSIIIRKLFKRIIDIALPIIKSDKILRKAFLRGEFAADGRFGIEKDTNTYYVSETTFCYDAFKEVWLRDFIIDCLKLEGIKKFNSIPGYIRITSWNNYIKLWNIRLFDRCIRKKNKFLKVVKQSFIHFKVDLRFVNYIIRSMDLTTTQLTELLDLHRTNLKRVKNGNQLLTIEQIHKILRKTGLNWGDVLNKTNKIRVGKLTYLRPQKEFVEFLINEKNLN